MRKLLGILAALVFLVSPLVAVPVNAGWVQQDAVSRTYTYGDHLLGRFYAVQGSPEALEPQVPDYLKPYMPKRITIYLHDQDLPGTISQQAKRVSSFKKEDGASWKTCTLKIFCTYFYPEVQVRKYEDYYVTGADPEIEISFDSGKSYLSGSSESYDALKPIYKTAFDAVLSLAGSPIGISWLFDALEDNSPLISGEQTSHLTINLKTSTFLGRTSYEAKYGILYDNIIFGELNNWVLKHEPTYSNLIDLDTTYTVVAGYWIPDNIWGGETFVPVKTDHVTLSSVDAEVILVPSN